MADTDTDSEESDEAAEKMEDRTGEESEDSGRETQTHTEQSADETEKTVEDVAKVGEAVANAVAAADSADVEAATEALLANMRTLGEEERAAKGEKFYSKEQKELLFSYFHLNNSPSKEHQEILGQKTGIDPKRVYYWFDNSRRVQKRAEDRKNVAEKVVEKVEEVREKRARRPPPRSLSPAVSAAPPPPVVTAAGIVAQYAVPEAGIARGERSLAAVLASGEAACVGVDITPQHQRCLLCAYTCSFRGNLLKHLRSLHHIEPKFCAIPRPGKSDLSEDKMAKGCRKTFTIDTFDLHICNEDLPTCFDDEVRMDKRFKSGAVKGDSCYSSGEEEEEEEENDDDNAALVEAVEALRKQGGGVCLGYEVTEGCTQCLLCDANMPCRGNLYKHINSHGYAVKFCCADRGPKSRLTEDIRGVKGCRKIFIADTFDDHTCTAAAPEQIGHWPLEKNAGIKKYNKSRALKGAGGGGGGVGNASGSRSSRKGGMRGFEKNFGKPDGSPAKFYNDRYTRLFHQLAVRTNIGLSLDTTFVRNGKMELCYLSDRQMSAVKDYLDDNDKYVLVSKG